MTIIHAIIIHVAIIIATTCGICFACTAFSLVEQFKTFLWLSVAVHVYCTVDNSRGKKKWYCWPTKCINRCFTICNYVRLETHCSTHWSVTSNWLVMFSLFISTDFMNHPHFNALSYTCQWPHCSGVTHLQVFCSNKTDVVAQQT